MRTRACALLGRLLCPQAEMATTHAAMVGGSAASTLGFSGLYFYLNRWRRRTAWTPPQLDHVPGTGDRVATKRPESHSPAAGDVLCPQLILTALLTAQLNGEAAALYIERQHRIVPLRLRHHLWPGRTVYNRAGKNSYRGRACSPACPTQSGPALPPSREEPEVAVLLWGLLSPAFFLTKYDNCRAVLGCRPPGKSAPKKNMARLGIHDFPGSPSAVRESAAGRLPVGGRDPPR